MVSTQNYYISIEVYLRERIQIIYSSSQYLQFMMMLSSSELNSSSRDSLGVGASGLVEPGDAQQGRRYPW